jgi:hypothetical protein
MDTYRDRDIIRRTRLKITAIPTTTIIPYQNLVAYELEVTCNSVSSRMSMRIFICAVSFDMFIPTIETTLGELDAVDAVELGIAIPGAILILDDMPGMFSIVVIAFEL